MKIFIASSKESKEAGTLNWLAARLADLGAVPLRWDKSGLFPPGTYTLQRLIEISKNECDAAIIIFSKDDNVWYRKDTVYQPRDNVLIEFGLFSGSLGLRKAIICVDGQPKQPSDLEGINNIDISPSKRHQAVEDLSEWVAFLKSETRSPHKYPETLGRLFQNWQRRSLAKPLEKNSKIFKLYSWCGITDESEHVNLQDVDELEQIYYLWADAEYGSSVAAEICHYEKEKNIRIRFHNKVGSASSNVAIRPGGRNLISSSMGLKRLEFKVRLPPDSGAAELQEVQLGLRVIDNLATHWIYRLRDGYRPFYVASSAWSTIHVNLTNRDPSRWQVFKFDGNNLYHDLQPDFTSVLAVVIEVGSRQRDYPGPGKGSIELKEFVIE